MIKEINIFDITFSSGNETEIINKFLKQKGYIVAPAAPALVDAENDKYFKLCLQKSTMAILDSGFLVLLNNLLKKNKVTRFSGLNYLIKAFQILDTSEFEESLWILPREKDIEPTKKLLMSKKIINANFYIAPMYPKNGPITDAALLKKISNLYPKHVFIGLGGGTQERLGYYLNSTFKNEMCIHCVGAAISFLNGSQVHIPNVLDRIFMGWLLRCLSNPISYVPRYLKATKIIKLYFQKKNEI